LDFFIFVFIVALFLALFACELILYLISVSVWPILCKNCWFGATKTMENVFGVFDVGNINTSG